MDIPTNLPQIPAYAERHPDGVWSLFVHCPFCGDRHLHGGGSDEVPAYGVRQSHCAHHRRRGGYVLVAAPDGTPIPVAKSKSWRRQEWRDADDGKDP